jgi:acyl-coenzyme A thioesterase PaaI-like protein
MTSIEFKLNFLAPGLEGRGPLIARSKLVKRGRTIGVATVDVKQGSELVATGLFTYLFFAERTRGERRLASS